MEGVFLPGFGNVGLKRPRNLCSDKQVASAKVGVHAELLLDTRKGGVCPWQVVICLRYLTANRRR